MPRCLTVVVHGTFAAREGWWKPGGPREATFADQLERALEKRGLPCTVWTPAQDAGKHPGAFAWSGRNDHSARVKGGRRLARALREVAEGLGATSDDPLRVNFVAHSHGGNVVLAALEGLGPTVRCGEIVMLGTPLLHCRPVLRVARFLVGLSLLTAILFFLLGLSAFFLLLATGGGGGEDTGDVLLGTLTVFLVIFPLLGWLSRLAAWGIDLVWGILFRVGRLLVGRAGGACYGPGSRGLNAVMGDRKILLVTSTYDEAELLLELGATPRVLYEFVTGDHGWFRRAVEWVFLKPGIQFALDLVEALLERWILGFSWWRVLFFDFRAVPSGYGGTYSSKRVERVDMTQDLKSTGRARGLAIMPITLRMQPERDWVSMGETERRRHLLQERIGEIQRSFRTQVQLRHSLYYECPEVIEKVAAWLTRHRGDRPSGEPVRG